MKELQRNVERTEADIRRVAAEKEQQELAHFHSSNAEKAEKERLAAELDAER